MNEIMEKEINIENMVYEINGVEVMLDSDLAELYHVETKRINEAVYRNQQKFPKRISWVASDTEVNSLWSQNATANISTKSRVNPRVFTEQGVYMLATVLKSNEAVQVSIRIMDTFVKMRHYINFNKEYLPYRFLLLEDKVDQNTKRIDEVLKKKYESQYNNVTFINCDSFHDRFIILDRFILYSCGASFKDLGKKCFAINEFNDFEYLDKILEIVFDK